MLDISYNKTIGQTKEFFPTILNHSQLERLYITDINLPPKTAIKILTLLKKNTKLKELDMGNHTITSEVCIAMAKTLQVNNTLEYLNIDGSKIARGSVLHILTSLKQNNALKVLWLPGNYIGFNEKELLSLEGAVNKRRKHCGYQEKLNVMFDDSLIYESLI